MAQKVILWRHSMYCTARRCPCFCSSVLSVEDQSSSSVYYNNCSSVYQQRIVVTSIQFVARLQAACTWEYTGVQGRLYSLHPLPDQYPSRRLLPELVVQRCLKDKYNCGPKVKVSHLLPLLYPHPALVLPLRVLPAPKVGGQTGIKVEDDRSHISRTHCRHREETVAPPTCQRHTLVGVKQSRHFAHNAWRHTVQFARKMSSSVDCPRGGGVEPVVVRGAQVDNSLEQTGSS